MRITTLTYGCLMAYAFMTTAYGNLHNEPLGGEVFNQDLVDGQTISREASARLATTPPTTPELTEEVTQTLKTTEETKIPTTLSEEEQTLFHQCANVVDNAGRLACFDAISAYDKPSVIAPKQSLDLTETFKSTIAGTPQVVLTENAKQPTFQDKSAIQDHLEPSSAGEVLTELGLPQEALSRYTPLSLAFDLDKNSERGLWTARPHNANYFLPFYLHTKPNRTPTSPTLGAYPFSEDEMRDLELKFQLSLKTKAMENVFGTNADLWIGYTQQSHWQVYNENNSRPFRAHDYMPEVFLTQPVSAKLPFGGKLRMLGVGGIHHSNGETDPVSRSWNRLYVMGAAEWGNKLTIGSRLWVRPKRQEGSKPEDNPDIIDYYGYGDVKFLYQLNKGNNISGQFRFNPFTQKGAVELDYVYPLDKGISGYVQIFHGYGQSLIDYNHKATSIGVGIMLNDWLGL